MLKRLFDWVNGSNAKGAEQGGILNDPEVRQVLEDITEAEEKLVSTPPSQLTEEERQRRSQIIHRNEEGALRYARFMTKGDDPTPLSY